ncbi:MAG: GNAT family N-acetyltransferase [Bacilli bacterium]
MKTTIRNEIISDYRKMEEIAREAFWNLYVPGCNEHYIVHAMRKHADYIPELAFVLEVDGELAGGIYYTVSAIVDEAGKRHDSLTFGPVFIAPQYHRKGLGRKLITHSIEAAKSMGHRVILILGYPYHYEPYGFRGGKTYNISMPDMNFYKGLLVLPLYEDALHGVAGYAHFSNVFEVTVEEVTAFDAAFVPKEKGIRASQAEFEATSGLLDE